MAHPAALVDAPADEPAVGQRKTLKCLNALEIYCRS
nr:MAG TPA: hypothetical protein [Caudoviricetes sp.]